MLTQMKSSSLLKHAVARLLQHPLSNFLQLTHTLRQRLIKGVFPKGDGGALIWTRPRLYIANEGPVRIQ
jgi:hypothetical protein